MKLFYITALDVGGGRTGYSVHIEGIARGLHECGWDVTLFSADRYGVQQVSFPFRHVLTRRGEFSFVSRAGEQIRLLRNLLRQRRERPDAVYMRAASSLIAPVLFSICYRVPFFVEINTLLEMEATRFVGARVKLENWVLRRARGVFTVTQELKEYMAHRTGLPPDRFAVVPNGCGASLCERSAVSRSAPTNGATRIGFLGLFQRWQGVETVLRAVALLRDRVPDITFAIAGAGELRGDYQRLADELGLSDWVAFPGFVAKFDIPVFLGSCAVVVAPYVDSRRTRTIGASPVKLFTYLASGKVVVASRLAALSVFAKCPAIRFATPDDPADFARAILEVLQMDRAERAALGEAGRRWVMDNHTWGHRARQTSNSILAWLRQ